jgi:hypothetical protein
MVVSKERLTRRTRRKFRLALHQADDGVASGRDA